MHCHSYVPPGVEPVNPVHATHCPRFNSASYRHARQRLYLKCPGRAYMRVLFPVPSLLLTRLDRASATALRGSEGVCAGRTPPGAVAEQATGPPRHHAPTPHSHPRWHGPHGTSQQTGLPVTVPRNRTGYYIHRRLQDHKSQYIHTGPPIACPEQNSVLHT